jgi:hypothetical protein
LEGEELWNCLDSLLGSAVVTAFKFTLYPITLTPVYLDVQQVIADSESVSLNITFGTGERGSKIKFKDVTLTSKLEVLKAKVVPKCYYL